MSENQEFTCIVCPRGCELSVSVIDGEITVTGNTCPRGIPYAKQEITTPMRSLCTTVRTAFKEFPRLPVRTNGEIPRDRIFDAMKEINKVMVTTRCRCGDIILTDLLHLSIDVIATDTVGVKI